MHRISYFPQGLLNDSRSSNEVVIESEVEGLIMVSGRPHAFDQEVVIKAEDDSEGRLTIFEDPHIHQKVVVEVESEGQVSEDPHVHQQVVIKSEPEDHSLFPEVSVRIPFLYRPEGSCTSPLTRFDSVSSLNTEGSFYQRGRLDDSPERDEWEEIEDLTEWYGWKTGSDDTDNESDCYDDTSPIISPATMWTSVTPTASRASSPSSASTFEESTSESGYDTEPDDASSESARNYGSRGRTPIRNCSRSRAANNFVAHSSLTPRTYRGRHPGRESISGSPTTDYEG